MANKSGTLYRVKYTIASFVRNQDQPHVENFTKICEECNGHDDDATFAWVLHNHGEIDKVWVSRRDEINEYPRMMKYHDDRFDVALVIVHSIQPLDAGH